MEKKFRALSKTNKNYWLYGGYYLHHNIHMGIGYTDEERANNLIPVIVSDSIADFGLPHNISVYEVILSTLGQYLGIIDDNKQEVYEGDIVECIRHDGNTVRYTLKDIRDIPTPIREGEYSSLKVVGNIHLEL